MVEPNSRPPFVVALEWVNRIIVFALEMALPGLAGLWIDGRLGSTPWCLVVGTAIGFAGGFYHLLKAVAPPSSKGR